MNNTVPNTAAPLFRAVTVSEIDSYLKHGGIIGTPMDLVRARYAKGFPGVSGDFPCLFCLEDPVGRPISVIWAIPDHLRFDDREYPWSWAGGLVTNPQFRGRGLATELVRQSVDVLHSNGYAWGGVFSTPTAMKIYRKLGFVSPGYVERVLLAASFDSVVRGHIGNRPFLGAVASGGLRIAAKAWVGLCRLKISFLSRDAISNEIPWDDSDGVESAIATCLPEVPFRFSSSSAVARLKMACSEHSEGVKWSFFSLSSEDGKPIGYYILRTNWQVTPLRGRYRDFWRVTLMDFGFSSNDAGRYDLLVREVVSKFSESGADWLDVVSSDDRLISSFRKALLVHLGNGMSFTFVCPKTWDLPVSCGQIESWHLNHSSGDGFLF